MTIIYILVGIWLLKAAGEVTIGLFQIAAGLTVGLAGACLYALSFVVEGIEKLCRLASGK